MPDSPSTRVQVMWKLKDGLDRGLVVLDAPYQREVVWTKSKMTALIDSIMNNFYVPPLVFGIRRMENGKLTRVCIDGKQRLTSIWKFMKNEIPYDDNGVEKYYEQDEAASNHQAMSSTHRRQYLSERERSKFKESELVCVEYAGLEPGEELELFSRVQLGMTLSNSEKLRANFSPVAQYTRDMEFDYMTKVEPIYSGKRGQLYLAICSLALLLSETEESLRFRGSSELIDFLKDKDFVPDDELKRKMKYTLDVYTSIAKDTQLKAGFLENPDGTRTKKPPREMEFVMFGLYIAKCMPYRRANNGQPSAQQLATFKNEFQALRKALLEAGVIKRGNPCYQVLKSWISRQMEQVQASGEPVMEDNMAPLKTEEEDQVEEDDEDEEDLWHVRTQKRRRSSERHMANLSSGHASIRRYHVDTWRGRPVARRGGRRPAPMERRAY